MSVLSLFSFGFWKRGPSASEKEDGLNDAVPFRVVVVDFLDNVESRSGENLYHLLQNQAEFSVSFFDEPFNKSFLNLESRTIFDMIDKGQSIIDKTDADILIWGCRENDRIRLNFQTGKQYEKDDTAFVSLLDSLYLPAHLIDNPQSFPPAVATLLRGAIISAVSSEDKRVRIRRCYLLKKIIKELSNDNSARQLSVNFMPYIMNFLGIIYLSYAYDNNDAEDFKITKGLFETALKHQDLFDSPLHLGCIYYHLGQLNDAGRQYQEKHVNRCFKEAIENYRQAQRYLGKYTYPYDYGYISYKLSHLYFSYWKQKEDIQALRDAVSQLREVEKIYSYAQFPAFWSVIQGELGNLLSILGSLTKSIDICQLAVNCYHNRQKVITERRDPLLWAETQESIGVIYFKLGREYGNRANLEDALECFHDALYVFENAGKQDKTNNLLAVISRTNSEIDRLSAV